MKSQSSDPSFLLDSKINYDMKHRKSFFQLDFEQMQWNEKTMIIPLYAQMFQGVIQYINRKGQIRTTTYKCYEHFILKTNRQGFQVWINYNNAVLEVTQHNELGIGIKLTKCLDTIEFYGEHEKWFNILKRYTIQLEFNRKYTLVKKIKSIQHTQQYQAKHKITGYDYMVTIYSKQHLLDLKEQNLLTEQLQIMRSLQDEHIQAFYETFENHDYIFVVNEIFFGGNFLGYLQRWPLLSEDKACKFFYRIFRALAYMHSKKIMHRDIKPEKIGLKFKDNLNTASIVDFHLAEYYQKDRSDYIYQRCGTPGYVAPEILANEPYDCKVDVFSTGVIVYMMLTGIHPFNCEDYKGLISLNLACEIDYSKVHITEDGMNFLKSVLDPNPETRLNSQQAINHPWFKSERLSKILEFKNKKQFELSQKKIKLPNLKNKYQSPQIMTSRAANSTTRITQSITVLDQTMLVKHKKTVSQDIFKPIDNQNNQLFVPLTQRKKLKFEDISKLRSTLMFSSLKFN